MTIHTRENKIKKIRKASDYWNPKFIWTLRRCNIEYKKALHDFKRKKYSDALIKYEEYIRTLNSADWNSYNELAWCYFELAKQKQKDGDQEYKKYYKKSISYFNKIIKRKPNYNKFSENLAAVKEWWKKI